MYYEISQCSCGSFSYVGVVFSCLLVNEQPFRSHFASSKEYLQFKVCYPVLLFLVARDSSHIIFYPFEGNHSRFLSQQLQPISDFFRCFRNHIWTSAGIAKMSLFLDAILREENVSIFFFRILKKFNVTISLRH